MAQSKQGRNRSRSNRRRNPSKERRIAGIATLHAPEGPFLGIDVERARNRAWPTRASIAVGVAIGLLSALLSVFISIPVAIALFVVVGTGAGYLTRPAALAATLSNVGGRPVEAAELPRVEALMEVLDATFGVAPQQIGIIDDPVLNAATIDAKGQPRLVLTTGLLESLSLIELEGVIGHLLARQRLDAVERSSVGAGLALLLGPLGRSPRRAHRLTGVGALFRADEIAAATLRYPTGLADALRKMAGGPLPDPGSFFSSAQYASARWLFIDPSVSRRSSAEAMGDPDATSVRAAALDEW